MTPEQALAIVRQAAESAPLPKAAHIQVEQALAVLAQALEPTETPVAAVS